MELSVRKEIILAAGLLLASSFKANASTVNCFDCNALQMGQVANDHWSTLAQTGPMYIVDARNGVVRKFQYRMEWSGNEDDPANSWIEEAPVPQNIIDGIAYAGSLIRAASVDVVNANPSLPELPEDVYQAIAESRFDDVISAYINNHTNAAKHNDARTWLDQLRADFFNPTAVMISIKFIMKDGSYFYLNQDKTTGKWTRVEGTERDSSGNKVPLTREQAVAKKYVFQNAWIGGTTDGSEDFYDLSRHLENMGVRIVNGTYGQSVTYILVMTCTPTDCMFYYVPAL